MYISKIALDYFIFSNECPTYTLQYLTSSVHYDSIGDSVLDINGIDKILHGEKHDKHIIN